MIDWKLFAKAHSVRPIDIRLQTNTNTSSRTHARMHGSDIDTEAYSVWRSDICVHILHHIALRWMYMLECWCAYPCAHGVETNVKKCEPKAGEASCMVRAWICWRVTNIAANSYRSHSYSHAQLALAPSLSLTLTPCACLHTLPHVYACKHTITIILSTLQATNFKI